VNIKLDVADRRLLGTVEDNGRHFDPDVELDRSQGDSPLQNILGLRERLELVGGRLDVFSDEGTGNSFEITLPFSE
jgi:signal transduction histidine kinase